MKTKQDCGRSGEERVCLWKWQHNIAFNCLQRLHKSNISFQNSFETFENRCQSDLWSWGYLAKENPIFVLQVRAIQHLEEKGCQGIPTKIRIPPYYRLNKQSSLRAIFVHLAKSAVKIFPLNICHTCQSLLVGKDWLATFWTLGCLHSFERHSQ